MANSNTMGGLITLRLKATDTRKSSPSPPPTVPLPPTPSKSMRQPQSLLRSSPLPAIPSKSTFQSRSQHIPDLEISPYTEADWREVMEEVKVLYLKRQYKQCSTRCIQVLESIKDPVRRCHSYVNQHQTDLSKYRVHPLYQIYLSFFAASSLEITSRSLHPNSSTKLPLLQDALIYYQNAESHMEYASFSADPTIVQTVRQTRLNSISSSIRSSTDSIFSHASSVSSASSSAAPSPTSSICSDDLTCNCTLDTPASTHKRAFSAPHNITPAHQSPRKKVSFSPRLPRVLSDEELELADDDTLLSCFPTPPCSTSPPASPPSPDSISDFLLSRALIRYRGHISDLHGQLKYHIERVETQIEDVQSSRKAWRSNLSPIVSDFCNSIEGINADEVKKVELRARIERLKQNMWKRERFDGRRYQDLCDKALGELDGA